MCCWRPPLPRPPRSPGNWDPRRRACRNGAPASPSNVWRDYAIKRVPAYDQATRKRILCQLDEAPPEGHATWTGELLAEALGDVSKHQVWRVLRQLGVSLRRRRSWCLSTDPEFARKAADIVGLYLSPPENAVVLAVDEKPSIQALERAQGWLRLPNGKALTGFSHGYRRHGTTTLPRWKWLPDSSSSAIRNPPSSRKNAGLT